MEPTHSTEIPQETLTVGWIKERLKDIPDDTPIGYAVGKDMSADIVNLINVSTLFTYNPNKKQFIIAVLDKNYVTLSELEKFQKEHKK